MKKLWLLLVVLLVGCGQLPAYDQKVNDVCGRLEGCFSRFVQEECNWTLTEFYILPEECLDEAVNAPTCADLGDPDSALPMCWPACDEDYQLCEGDTIHVCSEGQYFHAKCSGVCQLLLNQETSGACGRVSPDGKLTAEADICWCE